VEHRTRTALIAIVVGAAAVALLAAAEVRARSPARGPACPTLPRQAAPAAFHFSPGLLQHQSWIQFPVPEPDATAYVLCLDGRVWERGIGETPSNGRVEVNVNTAFVDLEWLLGRLDDFQQPERWQLRYTTYTIQNS
jgi:hypothetical protein